MAEDPDRFGYVHGVEWAMARVAEGKRVRREAWPEHWNGHPSKPHLCQVHLFGYGEGIIRGYGGVVGADPRDGTQRSRDMSGLGWSPTVEDVCAKDWGLV